MQASKIMPNTIYAVRRRHVYRVISGNGKPDDLVRFRVTAIITTRSGKGGPANTQSVIEGVVPPPDSGMKIDTGPVNLDPKEIEGEYTAFSELVAREEAERKTREATRDAKEKASLALVRALYLATGLEMPKDLSSYNNSIRSDGYGVQIKSEAVPAVLNLLEDTTVP